MTELVVSGLTKSFEIGRQTLDGISFQVERGERVGILGKNGAGKTTLLNMIAGTLEPDAGSIVLASGKRVGLVSQIPVYPDGFTVLDVLNTAFAALRKTERDLRALSLEMARCGDDPALLRRYGELTALYESKDGYGAQIRLLKLCNGLGIPEPMRVRPFSALSGGEQTRVNLARLMLEEPGLLLLDEPTNHLDLSGMEFLEEYLRGCKGTILAVSHDRYFLDAVLTRAIEIENGKLEFYAGNYSYYAVEKERRYEERLKRYENEQAKIKQLEEAAAKLHLWAFMGNDKLHKTAFSIEKRIERLNKTEKPRKDKALKGVFSEETRRSAAALNIRDLSKSFGARIILKETALSVSAKERIAVLGDNGAGKTTLLKLVLGLEKPDAGRIKWGESVKVGYLPQAVSFENPSRTVLDTLLYEQDAAPQTARNRLAAFHFCGEDVYKPVSVLSGGERARLRLCMLMDEKMNFLILDEPTNHLDIASRRWMEDAVEAFSGTLLFVSHDRYFINRFATRIWSLEQGGVVDFYGSFDAYSAWRQKTAEPPQNTPTSPAKEKPLRRTGGTKNLEKRLAALEREIAKAEARQRELDAEIEFASADYKKLQELFPEREFLQSELDGLYESWEELSARLEQA